MASSTGKLEKLSKSDVVKLLEKCKTEKDEAVHRESLLKEKLRQYETKVRSADTVRQKMKSLSSETRELRKTVKSLRTDLGLESSPKFQGKTTKDIIEDFEEKERKCSALMEQNGRLGHTIDELTAELANAATSKALLEEQVESLQQNLKEMTNNQRRLLKLWEDRRTQREQLSLPAIPQRPGQRPFLHKSVQTDMSISATQKLPPSAFESKLRWDYEKMPSLEKRGLSSMQNGFL